MHEHDGYAPHSHEVRPDHKGVPREPPPNAAGFCEDCGLPVYWHDERLETRDGQRWCFGPHRSRVTMERWHALPGMAQYVVPASTGRVCQCLARSEPHIHRIEPVTGGGVYISPELKANITNVIGDLERAVPEGADELSDHASTMCELWREATTGAP